MSAIISHIRCDTPGCKSIRPPGPAADWGGTCTDDIDRDYCPACTAKPKERAEVKPFVPPFSERYRDGYYDTIDSCGEKILGARLPGCAARLNATIAAERAAAVREWLAGLPLCPIHESLTMSEFLRLMEEIADSSAAWRFLYEAMKRIAAAQRVAAVAAAQRNHQGESPPKPTMPDSVGRVLHAINDQQVAAAIAGASGENVDELEAAVRADYAKDPNVNRTQV